VANVSPFFGRPFWSFAPMQLSGSRHVLIRRIFCGDSHADTSQIKDVWTSFRPTVGKVDHLEGAGKIKLTKQSSPGGLLHHFIPVFWTDHVDQHVHLNGALAASRLS
jgi:hypothetical protein